MVPKINFRWSFIYQQGIHLPEEGINYNAEKFEKYVKTFINKISKEWNKIGNNVLEYMSTLTGLEWKKEEIDCYVIKISEFGPISDPLTIPIQLKVGKKVFSLDKDRYLDMMIHELIHNLFSQHYEKSDQYFDYLIKNKYKNETWNASIHVPIHAIHKEIFVKLFNKKRLEKEIEACKFYEDYKKAWKIVNKEGSKLIIKELRKFLRT